MTLGVVVMVVRKFFFKKIGGFGGLNGFTCFQDTHLLLPSRSNRFDRRLLQNSRKMKAKGSLFSRRGESGRYHLLHSKVVAFSDSSNDIHCCGRHSVNLNKVRYPRLQIAFPLLPTPDEHFPSVIDGSPPFLQQHRNLIPNVLDNGIHLDIVAVGSERVLQLAADTIDPVERESDKGHHRHREPTHPVYEGEGKDKSKQSEDLFLMDAAEHESESQRRRSWRRL